MVQKEVDKVSTDYKDQCVYLLSFLTRKSVQFKLITDVLYYRGISNVFIKTLGIINKK